MFVMLVIGLGIMATTVTERKSSLSTEKTTASFQIADTGAEKVLQAIKNNPSALLSASAIGCSGVSVSGPVGSGTYSVTFYDKSNPSPLACTSKVSDVDHIKSIGTYANTTRAVQVTAPCISPYIADPTNTVGLWHFEESGTTIKDSSSKGNNGTPTGTTPTSGICNARNFGGGSDNISVPASGDWTFGTENFTIEFWVNFSDLENGTNQYNMISQHKNGGNMTTWFLYKAAASLPNRPNQLGIICYVDGTSRGGFQMSSPGWPAASRGVWYHIAFVRSGANGYIYIDGVSKPVSLIPTLGDWANIDAPLRIGNWDNNGNNDYSLKGSMDEVWISKIDKTATQISNDFCAGCKKLSPAPSECSSCP